MPTTCAFNKVRLQSNIPKPAEINFRAHICEFSRVPTHVNSCGVPQDRALSLISSPRVLMPRTTGASATTFNEDEYTLQARLVKDSLLTLALLGPLYGMLYPLALQPKLIPHPNVQCANRCACSSLRAVSSCSYAVCLI